MEVQMNKIRIHLIIKGLVQGVCFRAEALKEALRLDLKGWVKNCSNGSVEITAEGDSNKIEEFIRWCHQGPPAARVEGVEIKKSSYKNEFGDFSIRY